MSAGAFPRPVYVAGAAALTPFGAGWRGLAARVAGGAPPSPAVPALAPDDEPCEPRHRKMMSRAAYLAAAVVRGVLREAAVAALDVPPADVGCFLGVGASGGAIAELEAMLRESVTNGAFQLARFGDSGLEQSINNVRQLFVVRTLAPLNVVMNVEYLVGPLEIFHRQIDALLPNRAH